MTFIIMIGNALDGISFIGPFNYFENAQEYADRHLSEEWHITSLESPEKDKDDEEEGFGNV